ncbi:hypothetical protein HK098_002031 [Nowakowskiella sp. JEL0407]|nr:hypothetical protein HK098_002031 [Nowakowskiella sp. JEL0407]
MALPIHSESLEELLRSINQFAEFPESKNHSTKLQENIKIFQSLYRMLGPYFCISHCYDDTLPQERDIIVDRLRSISRIPVWFDPQYIGKTDEEKRLAFETMAHLYRDAEAVIVLLPGKTLQDALCRSRWLLRGWTFQEGVVAKRLWLWLTEVDRVIDFDENISSIEQNVSFVDESHLNLSFMLWSFLRSRQYWKETSKNGSLFSLFTAFRLLSQRKFTYTADIAVAASAMEGSPPSSPSPLKPSRLTFPVKGSFNEASRWLFSSMRGEELPEHDFCILRPGKQSGHPVCWAGGFSAAIIGPRVRWLHCVVAEFGASILGESISWSHVRTLSDTFTSENPDQLKHAIEEICRSRNEFLLPYFEWGLVNFFSNRVESSSKDVRFDPQTVIDWLGSMPIVLRLSVYESGNSLLLVLTDANCATSDRCATATYCEEPLQVYMLHENHWTPSGAAFVILKRNLSIGNEIRLLT